VTSSGPGEGIARAVSDPVSTVTNVIGKQAQRPADRDQRRPRKSCGALPCNISGKIGTSTKKTSEMTKILIILLSAFTVLGCTDPHVSTVKGNPTIDGSTTIGKVLDDRKECKDITWEFAKTAKGEDAVEYTCTYDISGITALRREASNAMADADARAIDDSFQRAREQAMRNLKNFDGSDAPNISVVDEVTRKHQEALQANQNRLAALRKMTPDDFGREVMRTSYQQGYRQLMTKRLAEEIAQLDAYQAKLESDGLLKIAAQKKETAGKTEAYNERQSRFEKNLADIDAIKSAYFAELAMLQKNATEFIDAEVSKDGASLKQRFVFYFPTPNTTVQAQNRVLFDDKDAGFFDSDGRAAAAAYRQKGYELTADGWNQYLANRKRIGTKHIFKEFSFVCRPGDGICKKRDS
jgi:hypothetical protein